MMSYHPLKAFIPAFVSLMLCNSVQADYSVLSVQLTGSERELTQNLDNSIQPGDWLSYRQNPPITVNAAGGYQAVKSEIFINPTLSGSWFNPETPGQGFFLDVPGEDNQVFLGWFTFDTERPEPENQTSLGDSGHRWLTAFGHFVGAEAVMDVTVTSGGIFNETLPEPVGLPGGQLILRFEDCQTGEITFDLGEAGLTGTIPIKRTSAEAARPCETLMNHAGEPGYVSVQ